MGYEPGDVVSGFSLANANGGGKVTLDEVMTEMGAVVLFECNHCPYVVGSINRINKIAAKAAELGMGFVGINSNDASVYTEDSFENMIEFAKKNQFGFPYLNDETQEIAKTYDAVCTPDFFGYNKDLELQYRGRLRELKNLVPVRSGESDLLVAMKQIAKTGKGPENQTPSAGCGIKWKQ